MSMTTNTATMESILATVNALPEAGTKVQTKSGTFQTSATGAATVNCGFRPDMVYIKGESNKPEGYNETFDYSMAMAFAEDSRTNTKNTLMWSADGMVDATWTRSDTGFSVTMTLISYDFDETPANRKTYTYAAVKYTT